jgi:hypothetical protein
MPVRFLLDLRSAKSVIVGTLMSESESEEEEEDMYYDSSISIDLVAIGNEDVGNCGC